MGEVAALGRDRLKEALASSDRLIVFVRHARGPRKPADSLVLRRASSSDGPRFASDIGTDSPTTFAGRLSERTRCYVVELDGKFVHATWVTLACAWTRELRAYVCPPDGDAYIYESFTRSDARGKGVYPFALGEICHLLAEEGTGRMWVAVEDDNPPSLRAVTKAGFVEGFSIPYRRRFGRLEVGDPEGPLADVGRKWVRKAPAD